MPPDAATRRESRRPSAEAATERRSLIRLYRWAFLVRVLAGFLAYGLTLYADLPLVEDARYYEEVGYEVARDWLSGAQVDLGALGQGAETAWLLVSAIAVFYYATGGVRALPVLLVAYSALTALVPIYVYRFTRELQAPEPVAKRAAWLVALSPAFVFWSGSLYKEGLTLLILSLAAVGTLRLQSGWQARSVITVGLCILALWELRYYLAIVLTVAVALSLLWGRVPGARRAARVPVFMRQTAIVAAFAALVVGMGVGERAEHVLFESDEGILLDLDVRRAWSSTSARSGYLQEASIATPAEALSYLPMGLFYFVTVPLPWQIGAIRQNLIIPENAFWLLLYPLTVVGVVRSLRLNRPGTIFLLVMSGAMCAIYALLAANVGTAYRMRSQVWLLWAPFAAWGWEVWRQRRRQARALRTARRGARLATARLG